MGATTTTIRGLAAATVLGAVASLTIMRGTDLTRLMVTLGVGLIMLELANKLDWLTGGADGLQGVMMGPLLGKFEFDLYGRTAAWYSLTVLLVFFLIARRIVQSPFGATLKAIRDNRLRAMAIGIPVTAKLAQVYTLAAALAGAAGALLTQTTGFASLDLFEFHRSADVMLILVIVIGMNGYLFMHVQKGFFPQQDNGQLAGGLRADQSISSTAMAGKLKEALSIIQQDPAIDTVVGFAGGSRSGGGFVFINLKPVSERDVTSLQVVARLRPQPCLILRKKITARLVPSRAKEVAPGELGERLDRPFVSEL